VKLLLRLSKKHVARKVILTCRSFLPVKELAHCRTSPPWNAEQALSSNAHHPWTWPLGQLLDFQKPG
jgi:hypothetical protein